MHRHNDIAATNVALHVLQANNYLIQKDRLLDLPLLDILHGANN